MKDLGFQEKNMDYSESGYLSIGDHSKFDIFREKRTAIPEIVLCQGKTVPDIIDIILKAVEVTSSVILSRLTKERWNIIEAKLAQDLYWSFFPDASMAVIRTKEFRTLKDSPPIAIITAGTSDIGVARESEIISRELGFPTLFYSDVGVAGIHRLLPVIEEINKEGAKVVIVAAGREGTLPTVVSGLTRAVVIGLPISTGYGMGGEGKGALYSMLQSCSPILVVNIDAGVIAGLMACKIMANLYSTDQQ